MKMNRNGGGGVTWAETGKSLEYKPDAGKRAVGLLDGAKEMAVLSSFLIADDRIEDAIMDASERGVRCYVMLAAENRLRQRIDTDFDQRAYDRHVKMLRRLSGVAMIRTSEDSHAKIILADPSGENPAGMLLTANLAREGLERNPELFVDLEKEEVREAFGILRHVFWEQAQHELVPDGDSDHRLADCKPSGEVPPAKSSAILQGGSNPQLVTEILGILRSRPKSVTVCSFGWDKGHLVTDELCNLARGGSDVTILARHGRQAGEAALAKMAGAGARVLGIRYLHAKAVVTGSDVVVMSANIERRGLDAGFELGIRLDGGRADAVRNEVRRWAESSQYRLVVGPKKHG